MAFDNGGALPQNRPMPLITFEGSESCEAESDKFHERAIHAYRELAKEEPKRVVLVDGRLSADAIETEIWNVLIRRFPELRQNQTSRRSVGPSGPEANLKHQTS
jgi:hypothetical protein